MINDFDRYFVIHLPRKQLEAQLIENSVIYFTEKPIYWSWFQTYWIIELKWSSRKTPMCIFITSTESVWSVCINCPNYTHTPHPGRELCVCVCVCVCVLLCLYTKCLVTGLQAKAEQRGLPVSHGSKKHRPHQQAKHVNGGTQAVQSSFVAHQVPLEDGKLNSYYYCYCITHTGRCTFYTFCTEGEEMNGGPTRIHTMAPWWVNLALYSTMFYLPAHQHDKDTLHLVVTYPQIVVYT